METTVGRSLFGRRRTRATPVREPAMNAQLKPHAGANAVGNTASFYVTRP